MTPIFIKKAPPQRPEDDEANSVTTACTSSQSADAGDFVLSETGTSRRIVRSKIVVNPHDPASGVEVSVLHRRKRPNEGWQDVPSVPLSSLKAGEGYRLNLNCAETRKLFERLQSLFEVSRAKGVTPGKKKWVVGEAEKVIKDVSPDVAAAIRKMAAKQYPREVWNYVAEAEPDLLTKLSYARVQLDREEVLKRFKAGLKEAQAESFWQGFFKKNTWIFGYGLDYRFLKMVADQPNLGGTSITGEGAQISDFLESTEGVSKFTVLVEIKKPDTPLLGKRCRTGVWNVSGDLTAAVIQLLSACRALEKVADAPQNAAILNAGGLSTVQPSGILVVGNTKELDSPEKKASFEVLRKSMHGPTILGFDELYERARFILARQ